MTRFTAPVALLALLFLYGAPARAASFDGAQLGLTWGIPFAGILLSIALLPLLAPSFWHHHFGKVSAAWALGFLVPFALLYGPTETLHQAAHTLLLEYLPFIIVLFESKGPGSFVHTISAKYAAGLRQDGCDCGVACAEIRGQVFQHNNVGLQVTPTSLA